MRIYNVLVTDNQGSSGSFKPIFVEEAFSLTGFIFQSLWLLYHKLWLPAIALIFLEITLSSLHEISLFSSSIITALKITLAFFVGVYANTLYIDSLKRNNYKLACVIAAKNLDAAKLRFYHEHFNTGEN